jgi:hypothetical protein
VVLALELMTSHHLSCHLSSNIEGKLNENYERELDKLKKRVDVRNLRTLMFFGEYNRGAISILNEAFKEMKSLRVLFIYVDSIESLPCTFQNLSTPEN